MLAEQLSKAWRARLASVPIDLAMTFAPGGLVLGAGTVLAPAETDGRRTIRLEGREARLVALLSAAHLRPVGPEALNHIRKAAERWSEGEPGLAQVHLALSRLDRLDEPEPGAQRLFLADELLRAGTSPDAILRALNLDPSALEPLAKAYNPNQPRVPAGNGLASGQWTSDGGADGGGMSEPASVGGGDPTRGQDAEAGAKPTTNLLVPVKYDARDPTGLGRTRTAPVPDLFETPQATVAARSMLLGLTSEQLMALALFAARFGGPAAALGMLFIPGNKSLRQEDVIPGWPPVQYLWHSDERSLILSYLGPNWRRVTTVAELGKDGLFRDVDGKVIGRALPDGGIAIDRSALFPQQARNENEPSLCPMPTPDKPHKFGVLFENYMKALVNPGNPTPPLYGVKMFNPLTGKEVNFDDCQRRSGILFDYKGPRYAYLLGQKFGKDIMDEFVDRAENQIDAAGPRHIVWVFAEKDAMDQVEEKFNENSKLRGWIQFEYEPWLGGAI